MAKKEDIQYVLTEKGKELSEKIADTNIEKDKLQSSINEEVAKPAKKSSAELIRELKELDKKIEEIKKLEKQKKKELKKKEPEVKSQPVESTEMEDDGEQEVEAGEQKHGMGYKHARDIRKKSFGSLLAEQEGGLGESLKKTISLKTKAKMTGIKETFDPLNIVKKFTFGSDWAPAMLGKLTGRSKEDTGYFANAKMKASQVGGGNTATKVGAMESGESSMSGILSQILTLLQKTNEEDTARKEEANQYKEILDAKREKRHKELIEALTGKKTKTADKVKDAPPEANTNSMFGSLLDALGGFKSALGLFGVLGTIFVGGSIASWFATAVASDPNFQKAFTKENDPTGMLGAMAGDSAVASNIMNVAAQTKEEKASRDEKNATLNKLLEDAPFWTRKYQVGAREYLMEKKGLTEAQVNDLMGPKEKSPAEERKEEKESATKLEAIKQKPISEMSLQELKQVKDSIVQYGDPRSFVKKNPTQASAKDLATAKQLDEIDAAIAKKESTSGGTSGASTAATTTASPDSATSGASTSATSGASTSATTTASPDSATSGASTSATTTASPDSATSGASTSATQISEKGANATPVSSAPTSAGAKLNSVTNENLDAKLSEKTSPTPPTSSVTNNSKAINTKKESKMPLPAVRNQEPTFQRMLLNSTRIV
jgi:hypothetical protein